MFKYLHEPLYLGSELKEIFETCIYGNGLQVDVKIRGKRSSTVAFRWWGRLASVLFVPSFWRFASWTTEVGKSGGKREKPATWRSSPRIVKPLVVAQTEEKLFHMRNCARPALRKFWAVPLFVFLSSPTLFPLSIRFETRSLIRRVALILASSSRAGNNLNCFLPCALFFTAH